jgi:hypothetical protein
MSIELCVSDLGRNHRRFFISHAHKELKQTALHVNLPLAGIIQGIWITLCIDLASLVSDNFKDQTFKSLDTLSLSGTFRLRKVFTLKHRPYDTTGEDTNHNQPTENIPKVLQFPMGVTSVTQVLTVDRLLDASRREKGTPFM